MVTDVKLSLQNKKQPQRKCAGIPSDFKRDGDRTDAPCQTRVSTGRTEKLHRSGVAVGRRHSDVSGYVTGRGEVVGARNQTETVHDSCRCYDRTQINGGYDALGPQAHGRQVTPQQLISHG